MLDMTLVSSSIAFSKRVGSLNVTFGDTLPGMLDCTFMALYVENGMVLVADLG